MSARRSSIKRDTRETQISVSLALDGTGVASFDTGLPFLEHMLDQVARHGLFDIEVRASGDLEIDAHHTVEDIGIVLGQAFTDAGLAYRVKYPRARIGDLDVDLIREFFQGFVNAGQVTLHIDNLQGINSHHIAETIFKAFGRAARMAVSVDPRVGDSVPSTKGSL